MRRVARLSGLLAATALWVASAAPARAEPPASEALLPLVSDAEYAPRANPTVFLRPSRSTGFPCCADPFQIARGPVEIRDEFMLAQVRLTLPATSPDVLPRGRWLLRLHLDTGNDFGFSRAGAGDSPDLVKGYMVDGERRTVEAQARRGLGHGLDAGIRVPVRWRGGGWLDGLIEWWHDLLDFPNNNRDLFEQDQYRVVGRDTDGAFVEWPDEGWGLGNVELDARWEFLRPARRSGWRAAVVGRVGLPTGTGPYETDGVDLGLQVVAARQLGRRFDLYGGLGGTWFSEDTIQGVEYEPWRAHGFLALEWRAASFLSLLVQTDAASRLVANLVDYPATQWYLQVGAKADLGGGWRVTAGMTQGLVDTESTVDVGFWGSLEVTF